LTATASNGAAGAAGTAAGGTAGAMADGRGAAAGPGGPPPSAFLDPAMQESRQASWGVLEWFEPGEYDRVERVLQRMRSLGIRRLRTGVSWAETQRPENARWFDWLLPRLAQEVEVIPCFVYTPPSLGVEPSVAAPPREPKSFADFLDAWITRQGQHFEWVELWNEPNSARNWDYTIDPDWLEFGRTVGGAAYWARQRGKKVLLGGMSPIDPHWLEVMFQRGVMDHVDAVGVHGFPGTWEARWNGWAQEIARVQQVLDRHGSRAPIWVSEAGYSTTRHDHLRQLELAQDLLQLPVERVYWYSVEDMPEDRAALSGFHIDEREYHFGLWREDGAPKLLAQVLMSRRDPRDFRWMVQEATRAAGPNHIVITGGAGFVGTNLAHRLLLDGHQVLVYDNLERQGSLANLEWLRSMHGNALRVRVADVRDRFTLRQAVRGARAVFHLAAQVAVTTSLRNVRSDFDTNAVGTLNVLEAVRREAPDAFLLYASTNKVYGSLDDLTLVERPTRWEAKGKGRSGTRHVSFATPYGCSKGAADQYVLDHARTFGMKATVFRMSCIYGPHQNGNEDQGWVAHFLRSARDGEPLTVYGDGKQVRDVLHVQDLVDAYVLAMQNPDAVAGNAWDIGGGPRHTTSLLELLETMRRIGCPPTKVTFDAPRPGDQRHYVSDIAPLRAALGWEPKLGVEAGLADLWAFLSGRRTVEVAA